MKPSTIILLLISLIPLVLAQQVPSGGTIIAGEATYRGERVDSAKITVEVPNTGYAKKIYSTVSHEDVNYYLSGVKANKGDYIIVTAIYKDEETTDYVTKGDENTYILDIELTDEPRLPPDVTSTISETTTPVTTSLKGSTTAETTAETTVETTPETTAPETTIETTATETTAETTIETDDRSGDIPTSIIAIAVLLLIVVVALNLMRR